MFKDKTLHDLQVRLALQKLDTEAQKQRTLKAFEDWANAEKDKA